MKHIHTRGFTLIELLVAVAIIALLSSIITSVFTESLAGARDAKRYSAMAQIQVALETYRQVNGAYPSTGGNWWGTCNSYGSKGVTGANGYVPNLAPTYMTVLPVEPRTDASTGCFGTYGGYLYNSNGIDYKFLVHVSMELKKECDTATDIYWDPPRGASQLTCAIYTPGASGW